METWRIKRFMELNLSYCTGDGGDHININYYTISPILITQSKFLNGHPGKGCVKGFWLHMPELGVGGCSVSSV